MVIIHRVSGACIYSAVALSDIFQSSDAGRPCGTCMKAHAHVIAPLAVRGEPFDPRPNCTYDDANEDTLQSGR